MLYTLALQPASQIPEWISPEWSEVDQAPLVVAVPQTRRDIEVKIASTAEEWEEAFRLVARCYKARGYEPPHAGDLRFTPFHALPDTVVFVAKEQGRVVVTLSLVPDNVLLGLPMEDLYHDEIEQLRGEGRRIVEVTCLADHQFTPREFTPVFTMLMRFVAQYGSCHGATTWVITINPRHRIFYRRIMGFVPFGRQKAYAAVQNHPAEAYLLDQPLLKRNAPEMFGKLYGSRLPREALTSTPMPRHLARAFGRRSRHTDDATVARIHDYVTEHGSPRRWR